MENVDANAIDLEALIKKIKEIWNGQEKEQDVVFDGVKIAFKRGQSIIEHYKNIKISNGLDGILSIVTILEKLFVNVKRNLIMM